MDFQCFDCETDTAINKNLCWLHSDICQISRLMLSEWREKLPKATTFKLRSLIVCVFSTASNSTHSVLNNLSVVLFLVFGLCLVHRFISNIMWYMKRNKFSIQANIIYWEAQFHFTGSDHLHNLGDINIGLVFRADSG